MDGWSTSLTPDALAAPTGTVADFSYPVALTSANTEFWANVKSDGGDIRATLDDGVTEVPVAVLHFDYGSELCFLLVKYPGNQTTSPSNFRIHCGNALATLPAASATYGSQNAMPANCVAFYPFGGGDDWTSSNNDLTMTGSPTVGGVSGPISGTLMTNYNGTSQYGEASAAVPSSDSPMSYFCLARITSFPDPATFPGTAYLPAVCIKESASTADGTNITGIGLEAVNPNWRWSKFCELQQAQDSSNAATATWYAVGGRTANDASRQLYINGTQVATNTTSRAGTANRIAIARGIDNTPARLFPGDIGMVFVFNADVGDDFIKYLSAALKVSDADQSDFYGGWTASVAPSNAAPVVDLNGVGSGVNGTGAFTEGDAAITPLTAATVTDADDTDLDSLTIVGTSGFGADGADDVVSWGAVDFPANADKTANVVAGATTIEVAFTTVDKTFVCTKSGGGTIPVADMQTFVRAFAFEDTAAGPDETARVFTFVANDGTDDSATATLTIAVAALVFPTPGDRTVTITATNAAGTSTARVATITVFDPALPLLSFPYSKNGVYTKHVGRTQVIQPIAVVNSGSGGTYGIASGSTTSLATLEALGFTLNTSTGELPGTIDADATEGVYSVTLECVNGSGSSEITFNIDVREAPVTEITSATSFPYYLNTPDMIYVLTENISADGSAIAVIADNCVLDTQGYDIGYDQATPITIVNASFESGTGTAADGWDFTNAPNAERFAGQFLLNEVYDGDYSLKFTDTTVNEYVTNTTPVALLGDTVYALSFMVEYGGEDNPTNPGAEAYVKLVGTSGEPTIELRRTGGNNRGIQLIETVFTTPAGSPEYDIVAGVDGHASSVYPFFIDDIRIQRTRVHGIAVSPAGSASGDLSDITTYGNGTNFTLTGGGSITQGDDKATWSHPIYVRQAGTTMIGQYLTVKGADSSGVWDTSSNNRYKYLAYMTIDSQVTTISNRDNNYGAVVHAIAGDIHHLNIVNGPHVGIRVGGNTTESRVHHNTVRLKARYSNAFAIRTVGGTICHDNHVLCGEGEYQGRGIYIPLDALESNPTKVFNNTVAVQALANNQEYGPSGGVPLGGTYGIQIESVTYAEVYGNDVTVYGTTKGFAFRMTGEQTGIKIRNNTFRSVQNGGYGACVSFYGASGDIQFADNTLVTDDALVGETIVSTILLERTHIQFEDTVATPYPMRTHQSSGEFVHTFLTFLDTTFEDPTSESLFENAVFIDDQTNLADDEASFKSQYTVTLHVVDSNTDDANGATVVIDDAEATEVVNDVTDANGLLVTVLTDFETIGDVKTVYTPHDINVTYGAETDVDAVTANATQTVELATA